MSRPFCKFYLSNQTCRFGNNCKFPHAKTVTSSSAVATFVEDPPRWTVKDGENIECFKTPRERKSEINSQSHPFDGRPDSCSKVLNKHTFSGSVNHSQREEIPPTFDKTEDSEVHSESVRPVCSFFSQGWCRYGRHCKFLHKRPVQRKPRKDARNISGQTKTISNDQQLHSNDYGRQSVLFEKASEAKVKNASIAQKSQHSYDAHCDGGVIRNSESTHDPVSVKHLANLSIAEPNPSDESLKKRVREDTICRFFKAGRCYKGAHCRFSHVKSKIVDESRYNDQSKALKFKSAHGDDTRTDKSSENILKSKFATDQLSFKKIFSLEELEDLGQTKLRQGDVDAIKKRFSKDKATFIEDEVFSATIKFNPTDPDWPFDVKEFIFRVSVPKDYPLQTLLLTLPLDQDLPATVRSYVEKSIQEWLKQRHDQLVATGRAELVFRPFLRWLDKNIEDITTQALKQLKKELTARAAGFEFISAEKLQEKYHATESPDQRDDASEKTRENDSDETGSSGEECSEDEEDEDDSSVTSEDDDKTFVDLQPQQRGTEVALRHLQLKESASALLFQKLMVMVSCGRCKTHQTVGVNQGAVSALSCEKCQNSMHVKFRPGLAHSFTSVIGYLDMDGCSAFDLVLQDCRASVCCSKCSKQTTLNGLISGQLIDGWCNACNARFKIATEAVKLTHLAPSGLDKGAAPIVQVSSARQRKPPKDPAIQEGQPLPAFGTCKHYKQSYRWLRFPCCGKTYPCDVCHDKKEDHSYELATRMICGHCCKEQNFSTGKPCSSCSQHMTKTHTAHWEGGSGCRDKISMSKGDNQKYKNQNKTVSKKKTEASKPKKKNTKLRHA